MSPYVKLGIWIGFVIVVVLLVIAAIFAVLALGEGDLQFVIPTTIITVLLAATLPIVFNLTSHIIL